MSRRLITRMVVTDDPPRTRAGIVRDLSQLACGVWVQVGRRYWWAVICRR